jgi:hypothetical protein
VNTVTFVIYADGGLNMSVSIKLNTLPLCTKCGKGTLLPIEDAQQGVSSYLKGWVCSNPECKWNVVQRAGYLNTVDVPELHTPDR